MFLSDLRLAIAWVIKQPFYYAIKVLGLAVGIMCAALLIGYVDFVKRYDSHIENRDSIYRVMGEAVSRESGEKVYYNFGSNAWIEPFKQEYEGLYDSVGILAERQGVLAHETSAYDQAYAFADAAALPLLGIDLLQGDGASALHGPNKVLLSERAAIKYFGTTDGAVGKTLTLDKAHYLGVSGVFRDLPRQSNYPLEVLVSLETSERVFDDRILNNQLWILFTRHTMLVSFSDAEAASFVHQDLKELPYRRSPEQHLPILERNYFSLWLQPLSDIYLEPLTGGTDGHDYTRRNTFYGMWLLAALVILGACVNYASLTIGQLQLRVRELGVRKSFGATRSTLLRQLLTESLIISAPAILLSVQLLYVAVPVFSSVVGAPLAHEDVLATGAWGWLSLAVFLLCALVSTAPILFARQQHIKAGLLNLPFSRFGWRAGSTVVFFQFAISTLSALMVLGIYLQVDYLQGIGTGFDSRNLLVADMKYQGADVDVAGFEALKNDLLQLPGVEGLSSLSVHPPATGSFTNWRWEGSGEPVEHTVSHILVDPDFLPTYRIALLAGRNFSLDRPSELYVEANEAQRNVGVLLTESAVRRFGMASADAALGQRLEYYMFDDPRSYVVIGVIEDFMFSPLESEVSSIAILRGSIEPLRSLSLRVADGHESGMPEAIREVWSRHLAEVPFNLTFMDDLIDAAIKGKTNSLGQAVSMAAVVFFVSAIIGIYAQASFVCERSSKSIAIRKVLGSTMDAILGLLLLRFALPVVLSFLLALPIAVYFIATFYGSFQETPGFPLPLYVLCLAAIVAIALMTVLVHCVRAASRHPVHSLRYE